MTTEARALTKERSDPTGPNWPGWVALVWVLGSLLGPLAVAGIWDPHELTVAELSRRIALHLYGAEGLALDGAVNEMPTRGVLGRGELPFTSIALGFRLFGLYDWAGRVPLAVWGSIGIAATYLLVARLADKLTAALSAVVLATTPLYFLQARVMLGDIVTMAAYAGAYAGLGVACFDRGGKSTWRYLAFGVGVLALIAGFLARGLLLGVAAPALGVGLSWVLLRVTKSVSSESLGDTLGALALFLGAAASTLGLRFLLANLEEPERYSWWLGFAIEPGRKLPAFDTVLLQLGHGLFPFSALIPFAAARLLLRRPDRRGVDLERRVALSTLVLVGPVVACAGYTLLAPIAGVLPFGAVAALAVIPALGLVDLDRGAPGSRVFGMVVGALALVLLFDFDAFPEKAMSAFVVPDPRLPETFRGTSTLLLAAGTLAFAAITFVAVLEEPDPALPVFERREFASWFVTLRELWGGNLLFSLLAVEAALVGFVVIDVLGEHVPALRQYVTFGGLARSVARAGWLVLPVLVVAPPLVMTARDALRAYVRLRTRSRFAWLPGRGTLAVLAPALFGTALSLVYYPKLLGQLSPKQTFLAYQELAEPGEKLAMIGTGSGSSSYYAGGNIQSFLNANQAFDWLTTGPGRRWLVMRQSDLAQLNSQFREQSPARANLPVLDATSSEVLLASNRLLPAETNQNPLESVVFSRAPSPRHRLDANLNDQLDVLGWEVRDLDGDVVSSVRPGPRYWFTIYYKVVAPVSGSWDTFIHIDGFQRRFNGDHPTLGGKYPFHLFRVGDFIADRYEFSLEPNFGPGAYHVYFGLFSGSRRMEVKRGRHDDDRVDAGTLDVE
jgi:4-amino-4-deoxy-L-arabinose transferase-like glycosyltransferase